jgi:UDP-N-acetylglucosamine 2-epimerase (non-hydrolysing)
MGRIVPGAAVMKLLHVVGARPNYMKIAPIMLAASKYECFSQVLVHTGQHYDAKMSDIFFDELELPAPNHYLGVGSGSHAQQTARIMMAFEPVLEAEKPDLVLVAGDVNSTVACALVAVKLGIEVAHVEAGLRSFDWTMPEEINRILTDRISAILFTPSPDADENLLAEGIQRDRIVCVGNVMIDTLVRLLPQTDVRWEKLQSRLNLDRYILVTLHRPSNVDQPHQLQEILSALTDLSTSYRIIFPVHPRTHQRIAFFR